MKVQLTPDVVKEIWIVLKKYAQTLSVDNDVVCFIQHVDGTHTTKSNATSVLQERNSNDGLIHTLVFAARTRKPGAELNDVATLRISRDRFYSSAGPSLMQCDFEISIAEASIDNTRLLRDDIFTQLQRCEAKQHPILDFRWLDLAAATLIGFCGYLVLKNEFHFLPTASENEVHYFSTIANMNRDIAALNYNASLSSWHLLVSYLTVFICLMIIGFLPLTLFVRRLLVRSYFLWGDEVKSVERKLRNQDRYIVGILLALILGIMASIIGPLIQGAVHSD